MSALALLWHRDGSPVDARGFAAMMAALAYRGPDGATQLASTGAWLGVCQHWTTPEDVGKPQAVRSEAGFDLALDGRLDNRDELIAALGEELAGDPGALSDTALAAAAYACWAEASFARLLGPFALAVADHRRRRLILARDPLGDRTLVYAMRAGVLAVASEEVALLALPWVSADPDEASVAAYLATRAPAPPATFFADIQELPAAHLLVVDSRGAAVRRYWELDTTPLRYRRDRDYIEHFLAVLRDGVRCRLRAVDRTAVLMSGGLDSASVAALAAREAAAAGGHRPLAVSWVFDELRRADERCWIAAMNESCALEPAVLTGDDAWPLRPVTEWFSDPSLPVEDPFLILHERAFAAARDRGARVVLGGDGGDHLYLAGDYWLADLLRAGRIAAALSGLAAHAWFHGVRRMPTRASARRIIARACGIGRNPLRRADSPPPWLSEHAAALLRERPASPLPGGRARAAGDDWVNLGLKAERRQTARAGVEMRRPYRDRRLVELCARLPGFVLRRPGCSKWLVRQALRGVLPEPVRLRWQGTSLFPLYVRGVVEREGAVIQNALADRRGRWAHLVRLEVVRDSFAESVQARRDGPVAVIPWYYLALDRWSQKWIAGAREGATVGNAANQEVA